MSTEGEARGPTAPEAQSAGDAQTAGKKADAVTTATDSSTTPAPSASRGAFGRYSLELSDDEIASPGILKIVLEQLETAKVRIAKLELTETQFHAKDKEAAVLSDRLSKSVSNEVLASLGLTVGGVLIGLSPGLTKQQPYGFILLGLGIVFLVAVTVAKLVRFK